MKKLIPVFLAMVIFLSCGIAHAAPIIIKIGSTATDESASGIATREYFKPYVEEKSGGRLKVEIFFNSILGGDRQMLESLQMNTLQADLTPATVLAGFSPDFNVADAPFLFKDKKTAHAALDGEFGALLSGTLKNRGIRILGYPENAFRNISTNKREVKTLEDMKGLKIRVMEGPVYINTMKALGANATPMSFGELYTAIQQGTVDGQDNGVVITYTSKLHEVVKYYTFTEHCYASNAYAFSEDFLQSLPPDLLRIVEDGIKIAVKAQRELNTKQEEEMTREMEKAGVTINRLSAEEKERWRKATAHVLDGLAGTVSKDVLEAARKVNEVYGK
ncbi:MAG: TRAP transporter substrate-binding protein [Deltaproteobacteria bacterium]|nr:TRAP transporter substrate-binding protein [Deltaproteobacteria bacterium]